MSLAPKLPPAMTVAEFLRLPGDGTGRIAELADGVVRLQDPASDTHGTITSNLTIAIGARLREAMPRCRVVDAPGVRPRVRANWNYRVPELGVTCQPNVQGQQMLPDPILLVEVLSPSNARDTWSNVPLYATMPSVQEILLVDSTKVEVHLLARQADTSWPDDPVVYGRGEIIPLGSIGLELAMQEVYRGTYLA